MVRTKDLTGSNRMNQNRLHATRLTSTVALFLLLGASWAHADGNRAALTLTASVQPVLYQKTLHQTGILQIRPADIARGYVEIAGGTVVEIRTNEQAGYDLWFEISEGPVDRVWVIDRDRTTALSPTGGLIHQAYPGRSLEVKRLDYRLYLKPDIQPGAYPWPLHVAAALR